MNFCKERDKYISLYLDELLDDKGRIEFLKHIDECSTCAAKLQEATYIADLFREDQDIQLPENFSSSLHGRLLEVSVKESKSKFKGFVYNKKFIASLSTAAILVISLLAYNLTPQMGLSKDSTRMANETAQIEASSAVDSNFIGSEDSRSMPDAGNGDGALSNNTTAGTQANSNATTKDDDVTIEPSKPASLEKTKNSSQFENDQDKTETGPSSDESLKKKEITASYFIKPDNQPNDNKYFSIYAELNIKVSPTGIEIEDLRKFMKEFGAIELKPVTINGIVENSAKSTAEVSTENSTTSSLQTPLVKLEYIDFYLPLSIYSTLESQATKYNLKFSTKNDIIKNDITDKYNILNSQKIELDKKIAEALIKGDNTSTFEAERKILTEEMDKIIADNGMITVRTFFIR